MSHNRLFLTRMATIQQAYSQPTRWTGYSPKYRIEKRFIMEAGLTKEEIEKKIQEDLKDLDNQEEDRLKKDAYKASHTYLMGRLQHYKYTELEALKNEIQNMNNSNSARFMGGYTGPAIMDHKVESERIQKYEQRRKDEIDAKFDGSPACLQLIKERSKQDDKMYRETVARTKMLSNGTEISMEPKKEWRGARHALAHGGGFNHKRTYAGNVFN